MAGECSFQPMEADFIAVSRGSYLASLRRRRFVARFVLIEAVGGVCGGAIAWLDNRLPGLGDIGIGMAAALGYLSLILAMSYVLVPRRSRRLFRQQRALDRDFTFAWTERGIVFSSAASRSELGWAEYHNWFESKDVFAFGLNEQLYHWSPKRSMTDEQVVDLRQTAAAAMPA